VGVYFIVTRLPASALPDMYGAGAFPINYPNEWDRRLGRTGYGIWIHGVPTDTYSRPPRASDGCMAVSNDDLEALWKLVNAGTTPVVIANGIHWQPLKEVESRGRNLMRQVQAWRRDWESLDVRRYSRHYAKDFRGEGMAREQWMRYKRRVNDAKRWVRIGLSDVSMFAYPGERDLVVVDFDQNYRSSNFSNRLRKRQYWREAGGVWRIVYEGSAEMRPQDFQGIPFSARTRLSRNENN